MKIDISKGRYWDLPWSLVDGCTPISQGCDHCWSAGIAHRTGAKIIKGYSGSIADGTACGHETHIPSPLTNGDRSFNGKIITHPERLDIPLKRRKPTVFSIWNDLFHEYVPDEFIKTVVDTAQRCRDTHTILALTKRPKRMLRFWTDIAFYVPQNFIQGMTACNQSEIDEKIGDFCRVPGRKFLSIEPCLGEIHIPSPCLYDQMHDGKILSRRSIDAVILGGETGPGARPMHPDWVRSVRDQCAAAGVPFFFKQWGEFLSRDNGGDLTEEQAFYRSEYINGKQLFRVGRKKAGRLLDGHTHDDLPWNRPTNSTV
jgi:protein gp37